MGKFSAQVKGFSQKAIRNAGLVIADAAQGLFHDATERQPSIKETGTFEVGKVPVDLGPLIGNTAFEMNGAAVSVGNPNSGTPPEFSLGLAGYELGDSAYLKFMSEYARRMNDGFSGIDSLGRVYTMPGRHFVTKAVNGAGGWQARIDASAAKFKD